MKKTEPLWLPESREFCRQNGIKIAGWGTDSLVVYSESPVRAKRIAAHLEQLGFQATDDGEDAQAGLLTLSRNPEATRAGTLEPRRRHRDFSQLPLLDRHLPVFFAFLSVACFWSSVGRPSKGFLAGLILGSVCLLLSVWQGLSVWGWKLQQSQEELRVRRYFVWSAVAWTEIRSVEIGVGLGRNREGVTLILKSRASIRLGTFSFWFARGLREQLREEIARRGM